MTFSKLTRAGLDGAFGFAFAGSVLLAASVSAEDLMLDANADGMVTLEEVQAVMPEVTAEAFVAMDSNGDGALDDAELSAAMDAGLLPSDDS